MARKKRREKKFVRKGVVHIKSTFNNTIVAITDENGNVVSWASGGTVGFKGTRKGTPYAAQLAAEAAIRKAKNYGLEEVEIYSKGPGPGKEAAIRAVEATGVRVAALKDVTPVPHNGCRPPGRRRV